MRLRRTLALAAVCAMAVAACGDDDDDGGAAAPATDATDAAATTAGDSGDAGGPVRGVTDDEVKIAIIATLTAQTGSPPFPGIEQGVKARIERANAEGGVAGRTITVVDTLDDNGVPTTYFDQVTKAVEQDEVFAIMTTSNAFTTQAADFMVQNKVPFFGWAYLPAYCDNPWAFGWNGCREGSHVKETQIADLMAEAAGKDPTEMSWVIQANDDPASSGSAGVVAAQVEAVGSELIYLDTSIPSAAQTTDYSPYVQKAIEADPDIVYVSTNFTDVIGMSGALRAAGYEGMIANGVAYVPGLLDASPDVARALEGSTIYASFPAQESQTPAIKQIEADLEAIGEAPNLTTGVQVGYWSADLFVQMLQAVGDDLTPERFDEVINGQGFTSETMDGGVGQVIYPDDHASAPPCGGAITVENGKYVPVVPFKCFERSS